MCPIESKLVAVELTNPAAVNKKRRFLFFIVAAFIDEIKLSVALKCARICSARLWSKWAVHVTWSKRWFMILSVSTAFSIYFAASLRSNRNISRVIPISIRQSSTIVQILELLGFPLNWLQAIRYVLFGSSISPAKTLTYFWPDTSDTSTTKNIGFLVSSILIRSDSWLAKLWTCFRHADSEGQWYPTVELNKFLILEC